MSGVDLYAVGGPRGRPVENAIWALDRDEARLRPAIWRDHVLEARALAAQLAEDARGREALDVYIHVLTARRDGLDIARAETAFALETARRAIVVEPEWKAFTRVAAERAGVAVEAVMKPRGNINLVNIRNRVWFALYAQRSGNGFRRHSLSDLGRRFGTHHTNVLHGLRRHCALHGIDPAVLA